MFFSFFFTFCCIQLLSKKYQPFFSWFFINFLSNFCNFFDFFRFFKQRKKISIFCQKMGSKMVVFTPPLKWGQKGSILPPQKRVFTPPQNRVLDPPPPNRLDPPPKMGSPPPSLKEKWQKWTKKCPKCQKKTCEFYIPKIFFLTFFSRESGKHTRPPKKHVQTPGFRGSGPPFFDVFSVIYKNP